MEAGEKDFLQKISPLLFDSFEPVDLLPYFLVNGLITDDDAKRIRGERERRLGDVFQHSRLGERVLGLERGF